MAARISGVYRIRNVVSGTFYIGSSDNIHQRFQTHRRQLRASAHKNIGLQRSWNRHGEDAFRFEIIHRVPPTDVRNVERNILVPVLNHPKCCNMHDETYAFPRTGVRHSAETKAKISAKVRKAVAEGRGGKFIPTPETRAKMSAALKGNQCAKGHARSEEHRRKLSEAAKGNQHWLGRQHTEESKKKMSRRVFTTDPEGVSTVYDSITALRGATGLKAPTVNRALQSSGSPISKGPYKGWRIAYFTEPC